MRLASGFRLSGYVQMQSGVPYTIFSAEPELGTAAQYTDLTRGSGGLYRPGFGRPSLCGSLDDLRQAGPDPTEAAFDKSVLCSAMTAAGGYPGNLGFGNLGRNELRGFWQRRAAFAGFGRSCSSASSCYRPAPCSTFGASDFHGHSSRKYG